MQCQVRFNSVPGEGSGSFGAEPGFAQVRFNTVLGGGLGVWEALVQPGQVRRVPEKVWEALQGQVQQGSGEGSGEGVGGFEVWFGAEVAASS